MSEKRLLKIILFIALISLSLLSGCYERGFFKESSRIEALVVRVIDGDTIVALMPDGSMEKVRLIGVDCPELDPKKNKPGEFHPAENLTCLAVWGLRAREFTHRVLGGRRVYLEIDPIAGRRDRYGRLLSYVYLENGTDFNAILVERGLARVYVEGEFSKKEEYLELQRSAIKERKGLWSCSS